MWLERSLEVEEAELVDGLDASVRQQGMDVRGGGSTDVSRNDLGTVTEKTEDLFFLSQRLG